MLNSLSINGYFLSLFYTMMTFLLSSFSLSLMLLCFIFFILQIARDGDKIVDFCSGGGHLGIAIAYLLPKCSIVLLDNKEKSLSSAKERIAKLGLQNTVIIQSNLDYFIGKFQVSSSLTKIKCLKPKLSCFSCKG